MSRYRTVMPKWMQGADLVDADKWVAAPTRAQYACQRVIDQDGELPDLYALTRWRYRLLARPLLWLAEVAIGTKVGRLITIGAYIIHEGPEESQDPDATLTRLNEKYEDLKVTNQRLQQELKAAESAAVTGENFARALREMAALIDEKGRSAR